MDHSNKTQAMNRIKIECPSTHIHNSTLSRAANETTLLSKMMGRNNNWTLLKQPDRNTFMRCSHIFRALELNSMINSFYVVWNILFIVCTITKYQNQSCFVVLIKLLITTHAFITMVIVKLPCYSKSLE